MSDQESKIDRLRQIIREARKLAEGDHFSETFDILANEIDRLEIQLDPKDLQQLLDELV
jgi:hypothetical protein